MSRRPLMSGMAVQSSLFISPGSVQDVGGAGGDGSQRSCENCDIYAEADFEVANRAVAIGSASDGITLGNTMPAVSMTTLDASPHNIMEAGCATFLDIGSPLAYKTSYSGPGSIGSIGSTSSGEAASSRSRRKSLKHAIKVSLETSVDSLDSACPALLPNSAPREWPIPEQQDFYSCVPMAIANGAFDKPDEATDIALLGGIGRGGSGGGGDTSFIECSSAVPTESPHYSIYSHELDAALDDGERFALVSNGGSSVPAPAAPASHLEQVLDAATASNWNAMAPTGSTMLVRGRGTGGDGDGTTDFEYDECSPPRVYDALSAVNPGRRTSSGVAGGVAECSGSDWFDSRSAYTTFSTPQSNGRLAAGSHTPGKAHGRLSMTNSFNSDLREMEQHNTTGVAAASRRHVGSNRTPGNPLDGHGSANTATTETTGYSFWDEGGASSSGRSRSGSSSSSNGDPRRMSIPNSIRNVIKGMKQLTKPAWHDTASESSTASAKPKARRTSSLHNTQATNKSTQLSEVNTRHSLHNTTRDQLLYQEDWVKNAAYGMHQVNIPAQSDRNQCDVAEPVLEQVTYDKLGATRSMNPEDDSLTKGMKQLTKPAWHDTASESSTASAKPKARRTSSLHNTQATNKSTQLSEDNTRHSLHNTTRDQLLYQEDWVTNAAYGMYQVNIPAQSDRNQCDVAEPVFEQVTYDKLGVTRSMNPEDDSLTKGMKQLTKPAWPDTASESSTASAKPKARKTSSLHNTLRDLVSVQEKAKNESTQLSEVKTRHSLHNTTRDQPLYQEDWVTNASYGMYQINRPAQSDRNQYNVADPVLEQVTYDKLGVTRSMNPEDDSLTENVLYRLEWKPST